MFGWRTVNGSLRVFGCMRRLDALTDDMLSVHGPLCCAPK
jgi:hypothetical protein